MVTISASGASAAEGAEVSGYTLVLPPGWERIPVRSGTSQAIRKILDARMRALPVKVSRDAMAPYRARVDAYLRKVIAEARKQGALDLYLPVEFRHGAPVAASFVISEGSLNDGTGVTAEALLAAFADQGEGAVPVTVDGGIALRRAQLVAADASRGAEYGSHRVDYILPVPGRGGSWLLVAGCFLGLVGRGAAR